MTAHEEQDERVVFFGGRQLLDLHNGGGFAAAASALAADVIGHAPASDLNQPGARIVGHAFARPLNGRREQGLLHGVLGGGEVAKTSDDRAEHLRRKFSQQVLRSDHQLRPPTNSSGAPAITCRTSMGMSVDSPPGAGPAESRASIS